MDRLDDDTVLMVVSDHGFKHGRSRLKNRPEIWAGNAAQWHRLDGVICLYGPGIKKGHEIRGATILDVAPTLLSLAGLPRAADMPGKVLTLAFENELQVAINSNVVATLEREREADDDRGADTTAASEEQLKLWESLGYLGQTTDNADQHNNLGQRYQDRGDFQRAIEEYKKAIEQRPTFHSAYNNIGVCYGKLRRFPEAEQAFLKAVGLKPSDIFAMNNLAVLYIEQRRFDDAVVQAERAIVVEPGYANGRVTLGSIYAMQQRYKLA